MEPILDDSSENDDLSSCDDSDENSFEDDHQLPALPQRAFQLPRLSKPEVRNTMKEKAQVTVRSFFLIHLNDVNLEIEFSIYLLQGQD